MSGGGVSEVSITVRCAFQNVDDINVTCASTWTVRRLKEHLHDVCPSNPAVTSQRLIFAGACLTDEQVLGQVLSRPGLEGHQVLHLVCPLPQSSPQLRQRRTETASVQPAPASPHQDATAAWQNYYQQMMHNLSTSSIGTVPSADYAQYYAQYYAAYMAQMSQWQAQQMVHLQQIGFAGVQMPHIYQGVAAGGGIPVAEANAAPAVAAGMEGNMDGVGAAAPARGGVDTLEMIYRLIRGLLFLTAIALYSSVERFMVVVFIAMFILFVQLTRRQRRAPPTPPVNNNNQGENNDAQDGEQAPAARPTGVQVFFSTFFSFITSFFTSLVPDHNAPPVNLN